MAVVIARARDIDGYIFDIYDVSKVQKYPDLDTNEMIYRIDSYYVLEVTYEKVLNLLETLKSSK